MLELKVPFKKTETILSQYTGESNFEFAQGMANRMDVSAAKYGFFRENYQGQYTEEFLKDAGETINAFLARWEGQKSTTAKGNAVMFILRRLVTYLCGGKVKGGEVQRGNTEYLMDSANGEMIEFTCPQVPGAEFKAMDSDGSTGFEGRSIGEIIQEARETADRLYRRQGD